MDWRSKLSCGVFICWILCPLYSQVHGSSSSSEDYHVKFLQAPPVVSNQYSATFLFEALGVGSSTEICAKCRFYCKLDDLSPSHCQYKNVTFTGLSDGNHTAEVCSKGPRGIGCAKYNWTVDTVPPTAYVTVPASLTAAVNVSVNITFSEPCMAGGGFGCLSANSCSLLVYGDGQVIPHTLTTIRPNLMYSLLVGLSSRVQFGRAILVMNKNFCSDTAGNRFTRTENSSFIVHFDRRTVFVDLRTHVPEQRLRLNDQTRTVQATNNYKYLKVYLYFTEPVLNTSREVLSALNISQGSLHPINGTTLANRRFGYMIENVPRSAIVTVTVNSNSIVSRQGTPVSRVTPATFLYDSKRPTVRLSTTSKRRTRDSNVAVSIKFEKPVFGFNSSHVSISGGQIQSFQEIRRNFYMIDVQAYSNTVHINIPENVTADVAGNRNLKSNILQVEHYSMPVIAAALAIFTITSFMVTCLAAGLLTVSTASLQYTGAFPRSSFSLTSDPTRNLIRIACYIQFFALSRFLAVTLPVEYYEFARDLRWSIPYFCLPWESEQHNPPIWGMNSPSSSSSHLLVPRIIDPKTEGLNRATAVYGSPLTEMEYRAFFESPNDIPEAEYIAESQSSNGWRDFERIMFWLAVVSGSFILLHAFLLLLLKFRKTSGKERSYGALVFPRFEIFVIMLALPSLCMAATTVIKGGRHSEIIVGVLLLGLISSVPLVLFLFLSIGITCGKLLQYKEVHQVGQKFHWYQELIRVTLGPGKRGQWTWKNESNSIYLAKFGPLFEDLRGPPKYMLSQITGGVNSFGTTKKCSVERIIDSDDETEDAEAPLIQKLFGILRIYYTLLETIKRFALGIIAGAYSTNWSSKSPVITLLCITSFQLFFMVLKKPFIKKKVQLVEIIAITTQVVIFTTFLVLFERNFSTNNEMKIGIFMLVLFLFGYLAQMLNEWFALYKQIKRLDVEDNSFRVGLKAASVGFLLFFIPQKMINRFYEVKENGETKDVNGIVSAGDTYRGSGSRSPSMGDKPWLKQLREMARAGFNKEGGKSGTSGPSGGVTDPSTSRTGTKWSGFWSGKKSENSSANSSSDYKSRSKSLYKDLEAIFASK